MRGKGPSIKDVGSGEKGGVKNWIKFADEYMLKKWDGCIKNILWVALVLSTKTYSMHVIKLKDKSMAMQDNEKCTTERRKSE